LLWRDWENARLSRQHFAMRYRLRTLLIVMAVVPAAIYAGLLSWAILEVPSMRGDLLLPYTLVFYCIAGTFYLAARVVSAPMRSLRLMLLAIAAIAAIVPLGLYLFRG
jgi:hypothetical protein